MGLLFVLRPRDDDDRDDDVIIVRFADDNTVRCFFDGINTPKTPVYSFPCVPPTIVTFVTGRSVEVSSLPPPPRTNNEVVDDEGLISSRRRCDDRRCDSHVTDVVDYDV